MTDDDAGRAKKQSCQPPVELPLLTVTWGEREKARQRETEKRKDGVCEIL